MRAPFLLALAVVTTASHATQLVDSFNTGGFSGSATSGINNAFQAGTMSGGNRLTTYAVQSNAFNLNIIASVLNGNFSLSSQAVVDGYGGVAYGFTGDPNNPTFADLNLDLSNLNDFEIDVLLNDQPADLTVSVRSSTQNSGNFVSANALLPAGSYTTNIAFGDFGAFDFSDVDQVKFEIDTDTSGDITIGEFRAVPEPATLGALAAGALLAWKKRRNQPLKKHVA